MLTFNSILRQERIDPETVRLVRHQDKRHPGRPTPYDLWQAQDGSLETYQRIQRRNVFDEGDLLASFVVTPTKETLFVGLYFVRGSQRVPPSIVDPIGQHNVDLRKCRYYDIRRDRRLADYAGHLIINWGEGFRAWVQRASRNDNKPILEIRKEMKDPPFIGFTNFCWDIDRIKTMPAKWQAVLESVKGVYLLVCKKTGKQYVGSAKGEENLWGRLLDYARTGHGGNIELKRRGRKPYQVTILEVVNSGSGIEAIEEAWKRKLMSVEFGLNRRGHNRNPNG